MQTELRARARLSPEASGGSCIFMEEIALQLVPKTRVLFEVKQTQRDGILGKEAYLKGRGRNWVKRTVDTLIWFSQRGCLTFLSLRHNTRHPPL